MYKVHKLHLRYAFYLAVVLLCSCVVFLTLINSLVCGFCTSAPGLVLNLACGSYTDAVNLVPAVSDRVSPSCTELTKWTTPRSGFKARFSIVAAAVLTAMGFSKCGVFVLFWVWFLWFCFCGVGGGVTAGGGQCYE